LHHLTQFYFFRYASGVHAPGRFQEPGTEPYLVGHNLLLAHAGAVRVYRTEFEPKQRGTIGIANSGDFRYPRRPQFRSDVDAAERAMLFQFGWFVDPVLKGDYPEEMRQRLGDRLPTFSEEERQLLVGSTDFLGLNYYSSFLASEPDVAPTYGGYWADIFVNFTDDPSWEHNDMGWNIVPDGLRQMLQWLSDRYDTPLVYVTENGSAEPEPDVRTAVADENRRDFFEQHLRACGEAIDDDSAGSVNLGGYFAWSLMDNFEWQFGYQRRFGLVRVEFEDGSLARTPKSSAWFYSDTIRDHGRNIKRKSTKVSSSGENRNLHERHEKISSRSSWGFFANAMPLSSALPTNGHSRSSQRRSGRPLPEKLLIGYGNDLEKIRRAVESGVNVVIWAFVDIVSTTADTLGEATNPHDCDTATERQARQGQCEYKAKIKTDLDLASVRKLIAELDEDGYEDTVHLGSFGGWRGPHLDPNLSASEWYAAFKEHLGDTFHGCDWDLEGHDDLDSPTNCFTVDCLNKLGEISRMMKAGTGDRWRYLLSTRFSSSSHFLQNDMRC